MIASLVGSVLHVDEGAAVIEAGGIGFRVMLPKRTGAQMRPGQRAKLYTHMAMNPSSGEFSIVGFEGRDELETYRLLLGVSGVGPKAALALLDALSVDALRSAVAADQPEVLTRVPGIGPKISRRIVLELKDRMQRLGYAETPITTDDLELVEALTALGYSVVEAQRAVQSLPPAGTFEERLRQAIAHFGR